jgi:hypothetical protein
MGRRHAFRSLALAPQSLLDAHYLIQCVKSVVRKSRRQFASFSSAADAAFSGCPDLPDIEMHGLINASPVRSYRDGHIQRRSRLSPSFIRNRE